MRLLYNQTSPFIRKVVVLAHETGLIDRIELLPSNPWAEDDAVTEYNPLGKVPVLLLEDNTPLFDSKLIAGYLLEQASNRQMLLPPSRRLQQIQLEAIADGVAESAANRFLELSRRPPEKQMDYWLERYQGAITRSLSWLEERADDFSTNFTLGAICVAVAIGYLELRYGELNWRDSHPKLAAWYKTVAQRDSMLATAPPVV